MVNATECVTVIMRRECTLGQKSHLFREKITLHPGSLTTHLGHVWESQRTLWGHVHTIFTPRDKFIHRGWVEVGYTVGDRVS